MPLYQFHHLSHFLDPCVLVSKYYHSMYKIYRIQTTDIAFLGYNMGNLIKILNITPGFYRDVVWIATHLSFYNCFPFISLFGQGEMVKQHNRMRFNSCLQICTEPINIFYRFAEISIKGTRRFKKLFNQGTKTVVFQTPKYVNSQ